MQKDLQSGKLLKVVVYHSAVAAHQTCAILCLSLLKELAEKLGEGGGKEGEKDGEGYKKIMTICHYVYIIIVKC